MAKKSEAVVKPDLFAAKTLTELAVLIASIPKEARNEAEIARAIDELVEKTRKK